MSFYGYYYNHKAHILPVLDRRLAPPLQKLESSIDTLSDEQILSIIAKRSSDDAIGFRKDDEYIPCDSIVYPISHDAVFKGVEDAEISSMIYVASYTSIPIPRVRRVLVPPEHYRSDTDKWLVMDRVDGEPLADAWPKMSWLARIRVIFYMRDYVRQLRSIPIPYPDKPGRFDSLDRRYPYWGAFFTTEGAVPFESYTEMADWFDRRRFDAMVMHHQSTRRILRVPKFDRTQPLVVSHMDLNFRNIMIDRHDIPWIIDWGMAGVFPVWFEYAQTAFWHGPYCHHRPIPWLWRWSMSFMFGNYGKYLYRYLYKMGSRVWLNGVYNHPLDYFTKLGIDVD